MSGNWPLSVTQPRWVREVSARLDDEEIEYTLIDSIVGIYNCKSKVGGRGYRFFASGGVIVGSNQRGIESLVKLLKEGERQNANNGQGYDRYSNRNSSVNSVSAVPSFREISKGRWFENWRGDSGRNDGAYAYA